MGSVWPALSLEMTGVVAPDVNRFNAGLPFIAEPTS